MATGIEAGTLPSIALDWFTVDGLCLCLVIGILGGTGRWCHQQTVGFGVVDCRIGV